MTTNDADWVEDVRRWYFNGGRRTTAASAETVPGSVSADAAELGYEAAHPSLQSTAWAKPPASRFGSLR